MIKKTLFTAAVALASSSAFAAQEVVIYGDEGYAPYVWSENGNLSGAYTDILMEADKLMPNFDLKIKTGPWKRILELIKKEDIMAFYPPYQTRDWNDYSETMFTEEVVVLCRKDVMDKARPNWPADYYDLTIGNNTGFASPGKAFFAAVKEGKIALSEAKTTEQNLLKLAKGRTDCYVNDRLAMGYEIKKMNEAGKLTGDNFVEGATISGNTTHVGYLKGSTKWDYRAAFEKELNAAIKQIVDSGKRDEIMSKYK